MWVYRRVGLSKQAVIFSCVWTVATLPKQWVTRVLHSRCQSKQTGHACHTGAHTHTHTPARETINAVPPPRVYCLCLSLLVSQLATLLLVLDTHTNTHTNASTYTYTQMCQRTDQYCPSPLIVFAACVYARAATYQLLLVLDTHIHKQLMIAASPLPVNCSCLSLSWLQCMLWYS